MFLFKSNILGFDGATSTVVTLFITEWLKTISELIVNQILTLFVMEASQPYGRVLSWPNMNLNSKSNISYLLI